MLFPLKTGINYIDRFRDHIIFQVHDAAFGIAKKIAHTKINQSWKISKIWIITPEIEELIQAK